MLKIKKVILPSLFTGNLQDRFIPMYSTHCRPFTTTLMLDLFRDQVGKKLKSFDLRQIFRNCRQGETSDVLRKGRSRPAPSCCPPRWRPQNPRSCPWKAAGADGRFVVAARRAGGGARQNKAGRPPDLPNGAPWS